MLVDGKDPSTYRTGYLLEMGEQARVGQALERPFVVSACSLRL